MKKSLMRSRWAAFGAAVAVTFGGGAVWVANASPSSASVLTVLGVPCRLLDTRLDGDSGAVNLGIRKGYIGANAQGGTVNNDITVIFDGRARKSGDKFALKYSEFDKRPIMGRCDAAFENELAGATNPSALLLNVTTMGANATTGLSQNFSTNGYITVYPWLTLGGTSGTGVTGRPVFSNVNPVGGLSTVHNNVTVKLQPIDSGVEIPNVACASGTNWGNSSCQYADVVSPQAVDRLNGFRVFNANGNVHIVIDVLGYYTAT